MNQAPVTVGTPIEGLEKIEPLVYTIHGNLPMKELRLEENWEFHPNMQACDAIVHTLRWVRNDTNEIVSQSAHVYQVRGVAAEGVAADLPGAPPVTQ